MGIDRRTLKRQAREDMGLPKPDFRVVTLTYILMTAGVSIVCSLIPLPAGSDSGPSSTALFLSLLLLLYGTVVAFGYTLWALWASRRLNPGPGALIQGFSVAGRVIYMRLLILVRLLGVCLIASLLTPLFLLVPLLLIPAGLVFVAVLISVSLSYALAPYLLADRPDDGAGAAVRRSAQLMRGWKWELFKLELSFWGWVLLRWLLLAAALGCTIWYSGLPQNFADLEPVDLVMWAYFISNSLMAFSLSTLLTLPLVLWLTPYQEVSRAHFYNLRLQAQQTSAPPL